MKFAGYELVKFSLYASTYWRGLEYVSVFKQNIGYLFNIDPSKVSAALRGLIYCVKVISYLIERLWGFSMTMNLICMIQIRYRIEMSQLKRLDENFNAVVSERETGEPPSADLIIVLSGSSQKAVREMSDAVRESRPQFIREGCPVIVLPAEGEGDGIGELKAAHFLATNDFSKFQKKYPHLRKEPHQLRVGVISTLGIEGQSEILEPLSLPGFAEKINLFQFAFPILYRRSQALLKNGEGGIVSVKANEPSVTPVELKGDILIFTNWLSFEEMKEDHLDALLTDINGNHAVNRMYLNDGSSGLRFISNEFERKYLVNSGLDSAGLPKRQMQSPLSGTIIRFRSRKKFDEYMDITKKTYDFVRERFLESLTADSASFEMLSADLQSEIQTLLEKEKYSKKIYKKLEEGGLVNGQIQYMAGERKIVLQGKSLKPSLAETHRKVRFVQIQA